MLCRNDECDEDGIEITSDDPEEAAEMFAKKHDESVVTRERQVVSVLVGGQWKDYDVWSEFVVRYHARLQ